MVNRRLTIQAIQDLAMQTGRITRGTYECSVNCPVPMGIRDLLTAPAVLLSLELSNKSRGSYRKLYSYARHARLASLILHRCFIVFIQLLCRQPRSLKLASVEPTTEERLVSTSANQSCPH